MDFSTLRVGLGFQCETQHGLFKKARPIINYSTSWPRKLGQAIGIALLEILNIVFSDLLKFQDVHAVLEQIRLMFQVIATDERTFEIHQSDIVGFYNQVEHDRILQAVWISQFIVSLLCSEYLWNHLYRHTIISWNAHYAFFRVIGGLRASSFENLNWLIFGIW